MDVRLKRFKNRQPYALLPDGRILADTQDSYETPAHLVLNWTSMLRKR